MDKILHDTRLCNLKHVSYDYIISYIHIYIHTNCDILLYITTIEKTWDKQPAYQKFVGNFNHQQVFFSIPGVFHFALPGTLPLLTADWRYAKMYQQKASGHLLPGYMYICRNMYVNKYIYIHMYVYIYICRCQVRIVSHAIVESWLFFATSQLNCSPPYVDHQSQTLGRSSDLQQDVCGAQHLKVRSA